MAHGGPGEVPNGLALYGMHHRLLDHGAITVREDLRVWVAPTLVGSSARDLFKDLDDQLVRLPVDRQFYPSREPLRGTTLRFSRARFELELGRHRPAQARLSSAGTAKLPFVSP